MSENALVPIITVPVVAKPPAQRLYEAWLSGRSPQTVRAYAQDLAAFRDFAGADTVEAAIAGLLSLGGGQANELVLNWRAAMQNAKLAPATINRRMAAVRSMAKLGRTLGMVSWSIEIGGLKSQPMRDTRGPGKDAVRRMIRSAQNGTPKGVRDTAILCMAYDLVLRRAEICRLDLADVDFEGKRLWILGKGRSQKEAMTLPKETAKAMLAWIEVRGRQDGPLFRNFDRARKGDGRLTGTAVYQIVAAIGERVGVKARPHGLRHSGISEALDLAGGDVRRVRKFSRHASVETVLKYDDSRRDDAGEIAKKVAAGRK